MAGVISKTDIAKIMAGDPKILVAEADSFGQFLAEGRLSKSQIRSAFGTVRQISAAWKDDADDTVSQAQLRRVLLLKPRLAYQARRDEKMKPLAVVLTEAITMVGDGKDVKEQSARFHNFVDLFEAILAYHTAYGGK